MTEIVRLYAKEKVSHFLTKRKELEKLKVMGSEQYIMQELRKN